MGSASDLQSAVLDRPKRAINLHLDDPGPG
jgi:hypothetical protein